MPGAFRSASVATTVCVARFNPKAETIEFCATGTGSKLAAGTDVTPTVEISNDAGCGEAAMKWANLAGAVKIAELTELTELTELNRCREPIFSGPSPHRANVAPALVTIITTSVSPSQKRFRL